MPRHRVQGIDLYYLLEGLSDGPTVTLIPGYTAPLEMWAPQMPALAPDYRILAYDMRGHGRSDAPFGGYDLTTHANDLRGLLDGLGIKRSHIVGDAAGGCIAVELALRHPERVQSLALIGTAIHGWTPPKDSLPPDPPEEAAYNKESQRIFKEEGLPEMLKIWWEGSWSAPMRNDPIRRRAKRFRDLILAYPAGDWQGTLPGKSVPPHYPRLKELKMPAGIFVGGGDLPVIKANGKEWLRQLSHTHFYEIPEAGHIPNWEFPEVFNKVLLEFLKIAESATDGT